MSCLCGTIFLTLAVTITIKRLVHPWVNLDTKKYPSSPPINKSEDFALKLMLSLNKTKHVLSLKRSTNFS